MGKYQVVSNFRLTNHFPHELDISVCETSHASVKGRILDTYRLVRAMKRSDVAIIFNAGIDQMVTAFISRSVLRCQCKTLFWDTILKVPASLRDRLTSKLMRVCLRRVDAFLCVHKDTKGYELHYAIPKAKFIYIPFKANNIDTLDEYPVRDDGYVLAGGASCRDYDTFTKAMGQVGVAAKIVLPAPAVASFHKTLFKEENLPVNIEVLRHDLNATSWNQLIARARFVVVPIHPMAIQSAGISVYLEAMALGKAVIVTDGVSTKGILTNQAEIVPAGDPTALAVAIKRLWEDRHYREELAHRGQQYALSLGNKTRLVKDILQCAMRCVSPRR